MSTNELIELIKKILEEKGPCTIEELLHELLKLGVEIDLENLRYIINFHPELFKWIISVSKDGKEIVPPKVTLTGGVEQLPPDENPHRKK